MSVYAPADVGTIVDAIEEAAARPGVADFPIGSSVTQECYPGVEFEVVAHWRGNCVLKHPGGTTHHAMPSDLTLAADPLVGHLYLLHFDRPVGHANHYLGFAEKGGLFKRLAQHEAGNGKASPLIRALLQAGGSFTLGRTWTGTRTDERLLKNRRNAAKLCHICRGTIDAPGPIARRDG